MAWRKVANLTHKRLTVSLLRSLFSAFKKRKQNIPNPATYFDASYYLATYPDVSAAKMDPWQHFYNHGYSEGRWPCVLTAVQVESGLWEAESQAAEQALLSLLNSSNTAEKTSAAWFLSRWYASKENWVKVVEILPTHIQSEMPIPGLMGPKLLWAEALRQTKPEDAKLYVQQLEQRYGRRVDLSLMQMNIEPASLDKSWWQPLNTHYQQAGLVEVVARNGEHTAFDGLEGTSSTVDAQIDSKSGLVSVIVPAYNAEKTIGTALRGLVQQSWPFLEVIVVDDASTDGTVAVVEKWVQQDARIRLLKQPTNQGAYITRNVGLNQSNGDYITVHDSDDWSHPQKIEQQILPLLENNRLKGTLSHWVRTTEELRFGSWNSPEDWNGLVHRNVSSLLIRRKVYEQLGYWDSVVCSADTEYYYRIMVAYGAQALQEVQSGLPLAFGRVREGSLTQRSETHVFSIFSGLRYDYKEAYQNWHQSSTSIAQLYMSQHPDRRPFAVSSNILPLVNQDGKEKEVVL